MTLKEMVAIEDVRALVARGQEQGFLSLEEVARSVEGVDVDASAAEQLFAHLEEMGVDLLDEAEALERTGKLNEEAERPRRIRSSLSRKADSAS